MPDAPRQADTSAIERLAAAVLAGESVEWDRVQADLPADQRGLVRQLRALAGVAGFYRQLQGTPDRAPALQAGTHWGPLHIERFLAAGSYGEVYVARDTRLDRLVALKLLRAGDLPAAHDAAAVLSEARRLARVRHPHVVTVHGAEHIDDRVGIWMELVPGETLADRVARLGPLPPGEVQRTGRVLAEALAAVHDAGLVHGDVKAQNVMCEDDGRIVLMDLGAGTDLWTTAPESPTAALTPVYAAPEVLRGEPPTPRADLYSLGVLLHLLATGRYPDRKAPAGLPRGAGRLAAVVAQALDPDPERRPASAGAVAAALGAAPIDRKVGAMLALALAAVVGGALWLLARGATPPRSDGAAPALSAVERVPVPRHRLIGVPARRSPWLPFVEVDGHVSALRLDDLSSTRVVTAEAGAYAEFTSLSADARLVAYQLCGPGPGCQLRVADRATGASRVLVPAHPTRYPIPLDWSDDGRTLLVQQRDRDGVWELALMSVSDGTSRSLRRFTGATPFAAGLSPDGRFVVFDHRDDDRRERDVAVMDVARGTTWALTTHDARDGFPSWTPDGTAVLFQSTRAGGVDAWLQPMVDGRPVGPPRVVARHLGHADALGFSGDTYYLLAQTSVIDAMMAPVDPQSWRIGTPTPVSAHDEGTSAQPSWSPDGRRIAYLALRGPRGERGAHIVVVRDLATGNTREYAHTLGLFMPHLEWSPDGRRLLLGGTDATNWQGLHVIDLDTGAVTRALGTAESPPGFYRWARDGSHILVADPRRGVIAVALATGRITTRLSTTAAGVRSVIRMVESRRGNAIAYSGFLPDGRTSVLRLADSTSRVIELARGDQGESLVAQGWTPDDRHVLFTRHRLGVATPHAVWRATRDGRERAGLGFGISGWTQANPLAISPDGRAIAFTAGDVSWEVSRLVNFLTPPASSPRF
jgi:serine/threonine protein kinase/Tol biopolymer transport system component